MRCAGDADDADEGAAPGLSGAVFDDHEHGTLRHDGPSGAQRAMRDVERSAGRDDADRAAFRGLHAAAARVCVRANRGLAQGVERHGAVRSLHLKLSQAMWAALERRQRETAEPIHHIVRAALADYLQLSHSTLFQVSTSGALVEGIYKGAVDGPGCGSMEISESARSRDSTARWWRWTDASTRSVPTARCARPMTGI